MMRWQMCLFPHTCPLWSVGGARVGREAGVRASLRAWGPASHVPHTCSPLWNSVTPSCPVSLVFSVWVSFFMCLPLILFLTSRLLLPSASLCPSLWFCLDTPHLLSSSSVLCFPCPSPHLSFSFCLPVSLPILSFPPPLIVSRFSFPPLSLNSVQSPIQPVSTSPLSLGSSSAGVTHFFLPLLVCLSLPVSFFLSLSSLLVFSSLPPNPVPFLPLPLLHLSPPTIHFPSPLHSLYSLQNLSPLPISLPRPMPDKHRHLGLQGRPPELHLWSSAGSSSSLIPLDFLGQTPELEPRFSPLPCSPQDMHKTSLRNVPPRTLGSLLLDHILCHKTCRPLPAH
ncbi:uncharacterized protein LOC129021156 [Pongo pygmaeus]|uniref:uncharacterized protein LOC129021156 n=1 Tax=Pongo pygmaeus TaxID=9600 RepID=UPI0023E34B97|nr:uncharacterized protein LOC129021156 [Pongo pygmaeus]